MIKDCLGHKLDIIFRNLLNTTINTFLSCYD